MEFLESIISLADELFDVDDNIAHKSIIRTIFYLGLK